MLTTSNRNINFYLAWHNYALALAGGKSSEAALDEQVKLAGTLLKETNLGFGQRIEVYQKLKPLILERPVFAIDLLKKELQQNKEVYATVNAEQQCWMRILLGMAYEKKRATRTSPA